MPAVHVFHRRTLLGGDDLQPAVFLAMMVRSLQLLSMSPLVARISVESRLEGGLLDYIFYDPAADASCRHSHYFPLLFVAYTLASVGYDAASIALEYRIAETSSMGSPTQTEPRNSKIRHMLELKLVPFSVGLSLVFLLGLTSISFAPQYYRCFHEEYDQQSHHFSAISDSKVFGLKFWWIALAILLLTQLGELVVSWVTLLHLCRQPIIDVNAPWTDMEAQNINHELIEEMWADRCASFCRCLSVASCNVFGGREIMGGNAEFGDIARALADYLETRGILDVVPSDIVMGFVILQQLQRARTLRARTEALRQDVDSVLETGEYGESSSDVSVPGDDLMVSLNEQNLGSSQPGSSVRQAIYRPGSNNGPMARQMRTILSRQSFEDMAVLEQGARYAKYALAIYTWVLYVYVYPVTGIPRILARGKCGCQRQKRRRRSYSTSPRLSSVLLEPQGRIEGDTMCQAHKSALLLHAGIEESDLVYAQLYSGFADTPYAILLDHECKAVILTIRGTFSLEDCVTDVLIDPEPLDELGVEFGFDGSEQYCHGGVMACVRNVYRDLRQHGLLERLLLGESALLPGYQLKLVGHSLGAATCTVLGYMLRPKFPTLRCVIFSPPGCSLTWRMANDCKSWCNAFVLDSDLVPRLSINSMEHFRDEILEIIGRVKVPKVVIARTVGGTMLSRLFGVQQFVGDMEEDGSFRMVEDMLFPTDQVPASDYQLQVARFHAIQAERRQQRGHLRSTSLFPPGKIVHLVKTGERSTCCYGIAKCITCCTTNVGFEYTAMYIENDDLRDIQVSTTMGTDHFPNRMQAILESVARDYGLRLE